MKNEVLDLCIEEFETVVTSKAYTTNQGIIAGFVGFNVVGAIITGASIIYFT